MRTLAAVCITLLATACASPGPMAGSTMPADDAHGAHHPGAMSAMEPRMQAMQEMHLKMSQARTAAEREALMAEHMNAMQGGMAMMREMRGMGAMGGKPMPQGMGARDQMMADHLATMQMMMNMMADRMPPAPPAR